MIGMAMRQHHGGDGRRLDAGGPEIIGQLSRRWLVARSATRVDQDQTRLLSDHDDIVDELELVTALSCCFQGRLPLRERRVRRDQEARREDEVAVAHHDRLETARLVDHA